MNDGLLDEDAMARAWVEAAGAQHHEDGIKAVATAQHAATRARYGLALDCIHPRWTIASTGECPDCGGDGVRWVSAAEVARWLKWVVGSKEEESGHWIHSLTPDHPVKDDWWKGAMEVQAILAAIAAPESASARDGGR